MIRSDKTTRVEINGEELIQVLVSIAKHLLEAENALEEDSHEVDYNYRSGK